MLFTVSGFTLIISHAQPVDTPGTDVAQVTTFARIFGAGTYSELIWALAIIIVLQILLVLTRWGLYTVAVGGNRLGAAEAGVKVRLVIIRNFILCSTCAALVGVLEAVRTSSVQPDPSGANEVLFDGISAAVIGGTLLAGGSGTVVGALIGALFLGALRDGLIIKGVNADYLSFYLGLAIIIAMAANTYVGRVRKGSGVG
jgi:simple sugar transport system permease protein